MNRFYRYTVALISQLLRTSGSFQCKLSMRYKLTKIKIIIS